LFEFFDVEVELLESVHECRHAYSIFAVVQKQVYDHALLERRDGQWTVHSCLQLPFANYAVSVCVKFLDDILHVKILFDQSLIEVMIHAFSAGRRVYFLSYTFSKEFRGTEIASAKKVSVPGNPRRKAATTAWVANLESKEGSGAIAMVESSPRVDKMVGE